MDGNLVTISPHAIVEEGVEIGSGTRVWEFTKIRTGAVIGKNVTIGMNVYIGPGVTIGDNCKIQNNVSLFEPASVGAGVFIGPGAILTNDKHPRATDHEGAKIGPSGWFRVGVTLEPNCSIGAGAICVAPVTIGAGSMVAAGAVVTRNVPPNETWVGVPARSR